MIDPHHPDISIARQCKLIDLSRASYYRLAHADGICDESDENLHLMSLIDEEYLRHPFLGSRKLCNYLRRLDYKVNRKRVQRLIRKMGLVSVAPKPNTSLPNKAHKIYPYLLRNLSINRPDQVWCTDITYIRLRGGFVYLVAIMDWYTRKVLSWELSNSMDSQFCVSALESAIRLHGTPDIFNSDQGSQFTSESFTKVLIDHDVNISMDGKGRWMDNVFIERLWRSVKFEEVYLREYPSVKELRMGLKKYFNYYNQERTHQSLGNLTPDEFYYQQLSMKEAA